MADGRTRVSDEVARSPGLSGNGAAPNGADVEAQKPDASPAAPAPPPAASSSNGVSNAIHPAVYVIFWMTFSSSVILFNKWILDTLGFHFPVILTTYHLSFATIMTQLMARYTSMLDGRKSVKMTGRIYLRAIVPIGLFFSLSLICGNLAYLYLSVAFIQMLKATTPVAVLFSSWGLGLKEASFREFLNVLAIVVGVIVASIGEIRFVMVGFLFQVAGLIFEALRLTLVQRILSSPDLKMDPLVSLYYFAPICAVMNLAVALVWEIPVVTAADVYRVGLWTFFANGMVAFLLNVSVVFLIGRTSSLVLTLCGVLKDIILVAASMLIWSTPVSGLQFFGYSIALGGMVYYKLGLQQIKLHADSAVRAWADYGVRRPVQRKIVSMLAAAALLFVLLGGLAPTYAPDYYTAAASKFGVSAQVNGAGSS